jgi:putative oxidoreductase
MVDTPVPTPYSAPPGVSGKAGNITLWILQILGALLMVFAAFAKLTAAQAMVELFNQIGFGQWFRVLTGTLEALGAIALLLPRLRALGAVALCGLLVGALITHATVGGNPAAAIVALLVMAIIAWGRRRELTPAWIIETHHR